MSYKKNVLIIAYACEPNKTSEPGVGWHFSKAIASSYFTTVLTRENNKNVINKVTKDNRTYIYYDLPSAFKLLKKKLPLGTQLYYAMWQWGAYLYAKKHIKEIDPSINIVHHLTFGISWIAPPAFLIKKPFIWGPIGGGDYIPFNFLKKMNYKSTFQESMYFIVNQINKVSFVSYLARKKAKLIIFRTKSAKNAFPKNKYITSCVISETASDLNIKKEKKHSNYLHVLCVGRMTYWKGFILAVSGFHAFLQNGGVGKLELFGDGPEINSISKYIKDNQLEEHIIIRGLVSNNVIKKKLEEASVLLHPSFRDGGSWSIMEAMSYGLPMVCLDTSGPRDMVTQDCGVLIEVSSPERVTKDIGKSLFELSNDSELFTKLSRNAQRRVLSKYSWSKRSEEIEEIYRKVLNDD